MSITARFLRTPAPMLRMLALASITLGSACSGVDVTPASTETFSETQYTRYAWRSEPPSQTASSRDVLVKKSPAIRRGVEDKMSELGYQRVDKSVAEFLIEYLAVPGFNDGQLAHGGSNDGLYGSSVNREIDGASEDNAQELSGAVQTGDILLVFLDATSSDVLWRVEITMVVEDANRVDTDDVERAVRQGLATLPPAS